MFLKLFLTNSLIWCILANIRNDFIVDYFKYKNITRVVGFSCNHKKDDLVLAKKLNKNGITSVLQKLNDKTSIVTLARSKYFKLGIFLDTNCFKTDLVTSLISEASNYWMFGTLHYWLIISSNYESTLKMIDYQSLGLSTDLVLAISSDENSYKLYDAYTIFKDRGTKLNITLLGHWNKGEGLGITMKQDKFSRRANLHSINLKASFFKMAFKPNGTKFEDYLLSEEYVTRDGQSKFGFAMLRILADLHNFSVYPIESAKWPKTDYLGPVARALAEGRADLVGTPIIINPLRMTMMKFVHQDWPFRTCFIFRNPQPNDIKVYEILRPLADEIWFFMIALTVVSVTVLFVVLHQERIETNVVKLSNSLLLTIGALCQQSTDINMVALSTRIAFLFIMIFGLIIYNYYSASVVSARLAEPIFKINDSLSEFGKINMKMASENMPYFEVALNAQDWETKIFYQNYWSQLPEETWYMQPEIGMRLVQKGGFAYHTHPNIGYPVIEKFYNGREICELMEVHLIRPIYTTFGVRFNSTFTEVPRVGLCKISEVGLHRRQVLKYQYRKPKCRTDVLSATSVTIYEFAPHLILLVIGMIAAAILFAFELLLYDSDISKLVCARRGFLKLINAKT